jgi:hypothetical protein
MFGGVKIITDVNLADMSEDWSKVRSPSRAMRRRARGFPQNIRIVITPKKEAISLDGGRTLIMHPAMYAALKATIELEATND